MSVSCLHPVITPLQPRKASTMRNLAVVLILFAATSTFAPATPPPASVWRQQVEQEIPLLGHRNWILIVDSAYPLQASQGIETIDTGGDHQEIVREVLSLVARSPHVRPQIMLDSELPFVTDDDAPGVGKYRSDIADLLRDLPTTYQPHQQILDLIDQQSRQYHILVLKTRMTIPYTSVFIRLDCRYWSDDAEQRLRSRMTPR